jgi:hypothetical protein
MHLTQSHSLFVPWRERIANATTGLVPKIWQSFFEALEKAAQLAPQVAGQIALSGQTASIAATALDVNILTPSLLRLTYAMQVVVAGGVSSSLTFTLRWTFNGVACHQTFTALTLNDVAQVQSFSIMFNADEGTSVTYEVAYVSAGVPAAQYKLDVVAETMP